MANELNLDLTPARTGYIMTIQLLLDGIVFGSPIVATELSPGYYSGTMSAPAGNYAVRFTLDDGTTVGTGFIRWDGTAEILDTPGTFTLLSRLSETRAAYLDAAISSRLAAISYTEPLTILQTANAVTDALVAYPVPTLAQTQAAGFTTERNASLVATEAAAKAVADGRHVIDYLNSIATQYEADGSVRTVFDLIDQDGNPATTAQAAVERVPQ
jgi:hypothetical protein